MAKANTNNKISMAGNTSQPFEPLTRICQTRFFQCQFSAIPVMMTHCGRDATWITEGASEFPALVGLERLFHARKEIELGEFWYVPWWTQFASCRVCGGFGTQWATCMMAALFEDEDEERERF